MQRINENFHFSETKNSRTSIDYRKRADAKPHQPKSQTKLLLKQLKFVADAPDRLDGPLVGYAV